MKKSKCQNKKQKNTAFRWIPVVILLIVVVIVALWIALKDRGPAQTLPPETTKSPGVQRPVERPTESFQPINLGYGIYLEQVRGYTGTYMEDGSDQLVSDVMMIRVSNTGKDDIQLMNIEVSYGEELYHFTATNLPAGSVTVLLELDRASTPKGKPVSAVASNVVLYPKNMQADFSAYEISGADGVLNVKNISGKDLTGDTYVYYKYKIQDIFYGGITFRVKVEGGLKDGEIRQITTGHYHPDNCEIILIETVQSNGT